MRVQCLILLMMLVSQQAAFAQSTFLKTIRNSGLAGNVIETTDGGYAFTGVDYARVEKKEYFDLIVVKLTSAGNVEWKKTIRGPVANPLMTQLLDESYVIVDRNFIVRLDRRGSLLWSKTIDLGGAIFQGATCIDRTSDGGFVLSGERAASGGPDRLYVVKLDSSGNIEWSRQFAGPGFIDQIAHTPDGGFILPSGRLDQAGVGILGLDLTRLDSKGNTLWNKAIHTTNTNWTFAGNPYAAVAKNGSTLFAATIVDYSNHQFPVDIVLVKFSSSGKLLWKSNYQTSYEVILYGVVPAADGNFVVFGEARGLGTLFLIAVNSNGNVLWNQLLHTPNSNSDGGGIYPATDGGFILSGSRATIPGDFSIYKLNADGKAPSCASTESTAVSVSNAPISISTSTKTGKKISLKVSTTKKVAASRWTKPILSCSSH